MQQRARHPRLSWLATIIAIPVLLLFGVLSARAQGSASTSAASSQGLASPAFTVSFGPGVRSTPVTGRLFVIISRSGNPAPRLQADQGGVTDTVPIYAAYEQMQAHVTRNTILVLVECQTTEEFREALGRLPIRKSSEWRSFDDGY